jgi:hypothetical protein
MCLAGHFGKLEQLHQMTVFILRQDCPSENTEEEEVEDIKVEFLLTIRNSIAAKYVQMTSST